jgi:type IV secretion system protein VirB11
MMPLAAESMLRHAMGPLWPFIERPYTQETAVNRPGELWWRGAAGWERHEVPELTFELLEGIATLSGALRRVDIGRHKPLLGTEIPNRHGGLLRLQACMSPAIQHGTVSLTLRGFEDFVAEPESIPRRYRTTGWNNWAGRNEQKKATVGPVLDAYDSGDPVRFLGMAMKAKLNIVFCAATGAGKTGLFKTIMLFVDDSERIITIEDSIELVLRQPNCVRLTYPADGGHPNLNDKALVKAALRMRPDRIPVQEIRSPEAAWVYVDSVMTGHEGSPTTIHGRSPQRAARRLFSYCKASDAGSSMGDEQLKWMIADAVDVIVPLRNEESAFHIKEVWLKDDAMRRGESPLRLFEEV